MKTLKMNKVWEWRGLCHSPADRYDDPMLKLPRAWEPSDSSRALSKGEEEVSRLGFSHRNQDEKQKMLTIK
jgi:hypothetical protein